MTEEIKSVPQQELCTHPQTKYELGNTYCAICGNWLYAGFKWGSVPTESRPKIPPLSENCRWLIFFEDQGREPEFYGDEATARERYHRLLDNWNCHLFQAALPVGPCEHTFVQNYGNTRRACSKCGRFEELTENGFRSPE